MKQLLILILLTATLTTQGQVRPKTMTVNSTVTALDSLNKALTARIDLLTRRLDTLTRQTLPADSVKGWIALNTDSANTKKIIAEVTKQVDAKGQSLAQWGNTVYVKLVNDTANRKVLSDAIANVQAGIVNVSNIVAANKQQQSDKNDATDKIIAGQSALITDNKSRIDALISLLKSIQ